MNDGAIELDAVEGHFRLRRTNPGGKVEEILLSDSGVMPVNQIGIGTNADKSNINLKMIDPGGFAVAFAVPIAVIKLFQRGLEKRVAELEKKMTIK
jgi:hypothetical protein